MKNGAPNRREVENGFGAIQESSLASEANSQVNEAFYDSYVMKLVEKRAKRLAEKCGIPQEQEDIQQDMLVGIIKSAPKYDPSMASVHTFVDRVLGNFSRDYIKRHYRAKDKQPEIQFVDCEVLDTDIRCVVNTGESSQSYFQQVAVVVESLPDELKEVCYAFFEKSNKRQVARDLNIDHKTLYKRIEKTKKVFIENGLEYFFQENQKNEGHIFENGICIDREGW